MPLLIEKPPITVEMWAALKKHIMKQREKKKQEQEADAAMKQFEREQEIKRKENAMTLEEIKEELAQLENKLQSLKEEKHEMFLVLKQVLHNDKKRNTEAKEANDLMQMGHHYPGQNQNIPPVAASNLYMIAGNRVVNRNQVMYKIGTFPNQQNGIIKRPRSPSPPPNSTYQTYAFNSNVQPYVQTTYPMHPGQQYSTAEPAKLHIQSNFHIPHTLPAVYATLSQSIDHAPPKVTNMQEEKYYIQAGGISAGYPIRTQQQAPSHFQPPTSHGVTSPVQVPLRKEDVMRRNMNPEGHR